MFYNNVSGIFGQGDGVVLKIGHNCVDESYIFVSKYLQMDVLGDNEDISINGR